MPTSTQDSTPSQATRRDWRNILIAILALAVAVQAAFLWSLAGRQAPEDQKQSGIVQSPASARILEAALPQNRRQIVLTFDAPVGPEKGGPWPGDAPPPSAIEPEVKGGFFWSNPYVLRFEAENALAPATSYRITLDPQAFSALGTDLQGSPEFTVSSGSLEIRSFRVWQEQVPDQPLQAMLKGSLEFSPPVTPEDLGRSLCIHDALTNSTLPVTLTTTWISQYTDFQSDPVEKTTEPRVLTVTVGQGLKPAVGEVGLTNSETRTVALVLDPDLRLENLQPESADGRPYLRLTFSTPVAGEALARNLSLTPPLDVRVSTQGAEALVNGDFQPGQEYSLRLAQGLTAPDGAVLRQDVQREAYIPDLEPSAGFRDQGFFLSRQGGRKIAVESVNAQAADVAVDRVYLNNLFNLLYYYRYSVFGDIWYTEGLEHVLGDRVAEFRLPLPHGRNERSVTPLDLSQYLEQGGPGLYRVGIALPGNPQGRQRWILASDLGLVAKLGAGDLLVSAASFANLAPLAGVRLWLLSDQNQVIAQGLTGPDGLWRATGRHSGLAEKTPYLLIGERGKDFSFLLFDQFGVDLSGLPVEGRPIAGLPYTAFVYNERDIYRPGEEVRGLALVRDRDLHTPPSMPLTLVRSDPQGRILDRQTLRPDERGAAEFSIPLADFSLTGRHSLQVLAGETVIGEHSFLVEDFLPDRIEVAIDPGQPSARPGDTLDIQVASSYFFGAPAAGLPVDAHVRLEAAAFQHRGYADYSFGDPEAEFPGREILAIEDRLDDQGRTSFQVELPQDLDPGAMLEAIIYSRVSEKGGRGVTAAARVPVHAYPCYPGLRKLDSRGFDPGEQVPIDYLVLDPDGQPCPGRDLTARLYEDRWQTVLKRIQGEGFAYDSVRDSRLVEEFTLPAGQAQGQFTVAAPGYGSYRLVIEDPASGASAATEFYAGGWGYSPWAMENPARLDIVLDKDEYRAGEHAKVQVRAPFAGRLLVTVETDGVRDVQVHELRGNTADILLPIRPEYAPNAYVSAVVVRGADSLRPGEAARAVGVAPLFVERQSGRLPLAVEAPAETRPETTLAVSVRAEPGSVLTVAAVDEGILQLVAQKTPDPFELFYTKRRLEVETLDIFSLLYPDLPVANAGPAGGDEFLNRLRQMVRTQGLTRVEPVSFWTGPVVVGPDGQARFEFALPQFNGALRIMAVAANGRRFGSTQATIRVRSPLMVLPTFPRFLAFGDQAQVPIALRNDTGSQGSFEMTLNAEGPAEPKTGAARLEIGQGAQELALFPLKALPEEGPLALDLQASGNGETASAKVELQVRSALPAIVREASGTLQNATTAFAPVEGLIPGASERELVIGAHPLIRYTGKLENLLGYPYGCLEQIVSKAFPLLYMEDLARELAPDILDGGSAAAMVQSGISRAMAMQLPDGGFSLWPGGEAHAWTSVYAAHFLLEASRAGYFVDKRSLDLALDFLTRMSLDQTEGQRQLPRAYAMFVLAQAGRPDLGGMDALRRSEGLDAGARTLLGAAYAAVGQAGPAQELFDAKTAAGDDRFDPETFDSALRQEALRLSVMLDSGAQAAEVDETARELARLLDATAMTSTQEQSWAFMALGKYLRQFRDGQPYSGRVLLDGAALAEFNEKSLLRLEELPGEGVLSIEMAPGFTPGQVRYSLATRGVEREDVYAPLAEGLEIRRESLTRQGENLSGPVRQGELLVLKVSLRSPAGPVANVAVQNLLPAGLEVENPRLETAERLAWMDEQNLTPAHQDLRDDRILFFTDLPEGGEWQTLFSLVRAVIPGEFRLPPAQAEAMYHPWIRARGELGTLQVEQAR